jgi:hypothetical protein
VPAPDTPPLAITAGHLAKVLAKVARGTAGELSGLTYKHVCAAAPADLAWTHCFINLLVKSTLPHLVQLLYCRRIANHKPGGGGELIAIGEVWVRIRAGPGLQPIQVGVGVPGGAECVERALHAALAAQPNTAIARIDYTNEFNTLRCQSVLQALADCLPGLFVFAHSLYAWPARL